MKKKYIIPQNKVREVQFEELLCMSRHDNGKHNGWNNPHNPHYQPDEVKEYHNFVNWE